MQPIVTGIFLLTSFLSAFLLFVVQPMATKAILPIFGGSPSVWNTAMVCFQLLLLGGYIYAHLITRITSARLQLLVHGLLLILSLSQLPIAFDHLGDSAVTSPILWTLGTLLYGIGLPFFCLSATAPLLQHWASRTTIPLAETPYRLYSVSNTGSMFALLGYLFLIEPGLRLTDQHSNWGYLYTAFVVLIIIAALQPRHTAAHTADITPNIPPTWRARAYWILLAFVPSSLMLGVTTYLSTDIASMPLLWVIPLVIYLLSFIVAFSRHSAYALKANRFGLILVAALTLCYSSLHLTNILLVVHFFALAIACFALHGMLAERKPHPAYLTQFYVCLSLGGALGGMFNALAAPLLFTGTTEYPLILVVACLLLFLRQDNLPRILRHGWILCLILIISCVVTLALLDLRPIAPSYTPLFYAIIAALCGVITLLFIQTPETRRLIIIFTIALPISGYLVATSLVTRNTSQLLFENRNFFGTVRVLKDKALNSNKLLYNTTIHGMQSLDEAKRRTLSAYYRDSLEEAVHSLPLEKYPLAVVGLGAGTLQCLAVPGQHVDFYDINQSVITIAETPAYFTYLRDCDGTHTNILGDGRLMLARAEPAHYGVIILDAFSSDAIPVHLLTTEALRTYSEKLVPGGIIIAHISNRYIDLSPLFARQAEALGMSVLQKNFSTHHIKDMAFNTNWVVLAKNEATLAPLTEKGWKTPKPLPGTSAWTDDYSNILPYFHFFD